LGPLERKGKIKLSFTEEDDLLNVLIEDDGVGLSSIKEEKSIAGKKAFSRFTNYPRKNRVTESQSKVERIFITGA
jgi:sensor histidine kinase YesM